LTNNVLLTNDVRVKYDVRVTSNATDQEPGIPPPPWRTARKSRPVRPPLSQELIVTTALAVLDREGLEGVSMRRIAQELDTGPASLYAHVANKDELLALMLDQVCSDITVPPPDPPRWQEQIKDVARQAYRAFGAHTNIALVSLGEVPTGPNALRISEGVLAILLAGGVPARPAGWFLDRLSQYIAGDAYEGSLHLARQRASGKDVENYQTDFVGQVRDYYLSLPPDRFPNLTSLADVLTSGDGDDRFEFGLEMLVNGIASYVGRH
jgi:AcrR family transcriptional regulator